MNGDMSNQREGMYNKNPGEIRWNPNLEPDLVMSRHVKDLIHGRLGENGHSEAALAAMVDGHLVPASLGDRDCGGR